MKIIWSDNSFNRELEALEALNATTDPDIEEHGIPRIYYHGQFLHLYNAIAMTLFDESLNDVYDRHKTRGEKISELAILLIFKQAVCEKKTYM